MSGKKRWFESLLVIGMSGWLAACSSSSDRVVNEDHQYLNSAEGQVITVPQGLDKPVGGDDFQLPAKPAQGPLGEALDIRAPTQLLALASGSRLDDNNHTNMIWFDKTDVVKDLEQFTWDALQGFLKGQKVNGSVLDEPGRTIQTGWMKHVEQSSFWDWSSSDVTRSYQYEVSLKVKPHGKTGSVSVALNKHQLDGQDVGVEQMAAVEKDIAEVGFLNEFVYHFQILQELRMDKSKRTGSKVITLGIAGDGAGQQVFHSDKSVDTVWVEFRSLVEGLGFSVDDVDRGTRKLFVSYQPVERSFWDSLWGDDDVPDLELQAAEYIIQISEDPGKEGSLIRFYDKDETAVPSAYYPRLKEALVEFARKLGLSL